jgi:hypothetical protein
VKQIHHEELEDGDKEWRSEFPKVILKQTDSGIQRLYAARERTLAMLSNTAADATPGGKAPPLRPLPAR